MHNIVYHVTLSDSQPSRNSRACDISQATNLLRSYLCPMSFFLMYSLFLKLPQPRSLHLHLLQVSLPHRQNLLRHPFQLPKLVVSGLVAIIAFLCQLQTSGCSIDLSQLLMSNAFGPIGGVEVGFLVVCMNSRIITLESHQQLSIVPMHLQMSTQSPSSRDVTASLARVFRYRSRASAWAEYSWIFS